MDTPGSSAVTKSGRTRQRILTAAAEVLHRDGFAEARLADIAERAGLQTASLYYHFDSKESLAAAVVSQGVQRILDHVRASVDTLPEGDAAQRLVAALTAHLEAASEADDRGAPSARMFVRMPAHVRHPLEAQNAVVSAYWAALIADAQRAGLIPADLDARTLGLLVLGSLNCATESLQHEARPVAEIVRHLTGVLLVKEPLLELRPSRFHDEEVPPRLDNAATGTRRRGARGGISVQRVVEAARRCFAEAGVAQTRMDDVARRAGVSRTHVYAFVASRAQLVELVALQRLQEMGEILRRRARTLDGDLAEAIVDQIIETIRLGRDDSEFSALADAMPRSELNALLTSATSPIHTVCATIFGALLARAMSDGRLRTDVPIDALVEWLQGVVALLAGRNDLDEGDLRTMARRFVIPGLLC